MVDKQVRLLRRFNGRFGLDQKVAVQKVKRYQKQDKFHRGIFWMDCKGTILRVHPSFPKKEGFNPPVLTNMHISHAAQKQDSQGEYDVRIRIILEENSPPSQKHFNALVKSKGNRGFQKVRKPFAL